MGDIINNKPEENSSDIIPPPSPPPTPTPTPTPWGTLEELLLVSSVNRHGSHNWVSVADELHKRPSTFLKHLNPDDCRIKYHHLRRRFNALAHHHDDDDDDPHQLLLLLQQLRNLRVQQLKRDLLQHDLSILSLQKKVKVLEDEREKKNSGSLLSVKAETEAHEGNPEALDLRTEAENANETAEPEKQGGGESTEDRSVNESNSNTNTNTGDNKREGQDPVERKGSGAGESKRENSINNDNNNKMKSSTRKEEEEEEEMQSSEVQSSASLRKKKKRRRIKVGGVNSSGDELEGEELSISVSVSVSHSPANKLISVKSQPLIRFLDFLRSHKHASVFHRRLPTQETEKFRNVVRQHMDLDMVQSRLDRGIYNESHPKFYRDLLLIFTNAILFYRKGSPEYIASREMRKLVLDELNLRIPKPKVLPQKPEPDFQNLEPVVKKPRSSTTMVVCRRRSSIQGLSESMKKETSQQQQHNVSGSIKNKMTTNNKVGSGSRSEEKAKGDQSQKKIDGSSSSNINVLSNRKDNGGDEGEGVASSSIKPLTKEQSSSLARGTLRMSNNNSKKIVSKDGSKREKTGNSGDNKEGSFKGGEGDEVTEKRKVNSDQKSEKASTTTVLKKQGVANFLKRIKQNSPSSQEKAKNNDSDDEEEDDDEKLERKERTDSIGRKAGGNGRKNGNMGKEAVDVVVTRRTSGRKGEKEAAGSIRATGRPPKRKAAMMGGGTSDSGKRRKSGGGGGDEENSRKKSRR